MIYNLFKFPVLIVNIDTSKIVLKNDKFEKTWLSKTKSSFNSNNNLSEDSKEYLLKIIANNLFQIINKPFKLELQQIWENIYEKGDFQEKHTHPGSHFSFIIYKKIKNPHTIFFNPIHNLLMSYYNENDHIQDLFKIHEKIEIREQQMIIFPSFLEHMVEKTDDSVTVSGNTILKML